MLDVGTHKAKVTGWGVSKNQKGDAQPFFEFTTDENKKGTWYGTFDASRGKGQEITFNVFRTLGFTGSHPGEIALTQAKSPLLFNTDKVVELDVVDETWTTKDGESKTTRKIKWVNDPDKPVGPKAVDVDEAKKLIAGMNIEGDWAAFKQSTGMQDNTSVPF